MVQYPDKLASLVEKLREDLLHDRYVPEEEKQRLKNHGFQPGADQDVTRRRMMELLSVADFDLFVFYSRKSSVSRSEEALRGALLNHLLESRLSHPKWPIAAISGRIPRLPESLQAFKAASGPRRPTVDIPPSQVPTKASPILLVTQYACDIVRARLAQVLAGPPYPPQSDATRIRTKLRMAEDIDTGERFHRERPLP
ncbi:hypothetical protein JY572_38495 [Myxococcus landrumensis]|uniref:Uncharacterized protein n=2 Tax=Myxococcus landrumensis TaxID=2813577 RepID=A0ABX7NI57_9BACT|nr:hypothetical protein JY572_38495 [Myxococcus landrumus]